MAKNNNEAKIKFSADITGFKKGMAQANSELKGLTAELKLNETQMKGNGASVEALEGKHGILERQLKATQSKAELLTAEIERQSQKAEVDEAKIQQLKTQLTNVQTAEERLKQKIAACNTEIENQKKSADEAKSATAQLTDKIEQQQTELNGLKDEYVEAVLQYGKNSKEAKELAKEIGKLSGELKESKAAFDGASDKADKLDKSLDDAGDSAGNSADGFTIAKGAIADLAANAISAAIGKVSEFISYLRELPEATRELRQDMATLETSYARAGFTVEEATNTWKDLYRVFGEDDRAVEAANLIAKMSDNQEDLNTWVTITQGIWGSYQDSLPVEGLAEASMETARVGQVTGVLADALNWSSEAATMFAQYMSEDVTTAEDAFNEALKGCTTEQERQALITETLTALYGDAAAEYEKASGAQLAAKEATAENTLAQAELADAVEPLTTEWDNLKTQMVTAIIPAVEKISQWGISALEWMQEHPVAMKVMGAVLGVLAAAISALIIVVTAWTVAQWALNSAILANPITWIIVAVVAAIAAVVAIVVLVIEYWDEIVAAVERCWGAVKNTLSQWGTWINDNVIQPIVNFFKGIWDGIVAVFQSVIEWVKANWQSIVSFIINPFAGIFKYLWDNCEVFRNFLTGVGTWIYENVILPVANFFVELWNNIVSAYHTVVDPWIEIVKRISAIIYESVIQPVAQFFVDLWNGIVSGVQAAWDWCVNLALTVAGWVNTNVIQPVANFFVNLWTGIKNGVSTAIQTVKNVFATVSGWVNEKVIQPVSKFFSNLWTGFKNGAKNAWEGVKSVFSAVGSFFGNVFGIVKDKIVSVFQAGGKVFNNIKDGIVSVFKTVVNGIITGINKVVKLPFEGLNTILNKIHKIEIVGVKPFSWLTWRAPIPQIPLLAKGGIVDRPTLNIAGEAGAEAIIPIDKLQTYIMGAVEKTMQAVNINALAAAVEDLANRPVDLYVNGRKFAEATAGDTDSVGGLRNVFKSRGLAVE